MRRVLVSLAILLALAITGLAVYGGRVENTPFSWKRPSTLGFKSGRFAPCRASPNCVSSQAPRDDAGHFVEPIPFQGNTLEAIAAARRAVASSERAAVVDTGPNYVHAEFRSLVFRFVDDVEFGYDPGARLIHVRSASRLGRYDFGANRARIERLRAAIEQQPRSTGKAAAAGTQ